LPVFAFRGFLPLLAPLSTYNIQFAFRKPKPPRQDFPSLTRCILSFSQRPNAFFQTLLCRLIASCYQLWGPPACQLLARVLRCYQLIAYDSNHLSIRRGLTPFEVFPSLTAGSRHRLPWPSCRFGHSSTCAYQSPPTPRLYSISESVLHSTHCCIKHNRYSHGFAPPTRSSLQTHRPSNSSVAHLGSFIDATLATSR